MIQLRLLLLGAALLGGIGMAVYRHYKSREQQQQHSYGNTSSRGSSDTDRGSQVSVSVPRRLRIKRRPRRDPEEICSICLSEVLTENRLLECGHDFHKRCIEAWLNSENKICPNCRAPAL